MPGLPADEPIPPREDGLAVALGGRLDPEVDDVAVTDLVGGLGDEHLGVLGGDDLDGVAEARADGDGARLGARVHGDRRRLVGVSHGPEQQECRERPHLTSGRGR